LSDEQISTNLLTLGGINGSIDPELLVGEWEFIKFAYTADGKIISNEKTISKLSVVNHPHTKIMKILNDDPMQYISEAIPDLSGPWVFMNNYLFYSISNNLMNFSRLSDHSYAIDLHVTDEGKEVLNALKAAYSFVIKGNELIIHFKRIENKNLIILQKR